MTKCLEMLKNMHVMRDVNKDTVKLDADYVKGIYIQDKQMQNGKIHVAIEFEEQYYYEILSDLIGTPISGEYELIATLKRTCRKESGISKYRDRVPAGKGPRVRHRHSDDGRN